MIWTVKKISEDDTFINIGYSYEENQNCDGLILYNKNNKTFELKKISPIEGYSEKKCRWFGERTFQFLHGLIRLNRLTYKPYRIVTG